MIDQIHYTQISLADLDKIRTRLTQLSLTYIPHVLDRLNTWSIPNLPPPEDCKIIEFNTHNDDARVLLRHTTGICYVVSLKTGQVITAYYNDPNDKHTTINMNKYTKNLKIIW